MLIASNITQKLWFPRVVPFLLFIAFIALDGFVDFLAYHFPILTTFENYDEQFYYPVKTILVAALLILFWKRYTEINLRQLLSLKNILAGILSGAVVFLLWINMDWKFATQGEMEEFNPFLLDSPSLIVTIIFFRLLGAAIVVPVFEEIFWRSFILRFIINPRFEEVPIGEFTWTSFVISSILFGLEHNLYLAGIMAGIVYCLVLYYTKSLATTILSHGVTNLLLGIYVLTTGNWQFW